MKDVQLQIHRHRLEGIAEETGDVLQRTAFSPNIKERRDFSCALTDTRGRLVAQAAHIPVHLGSIPETMRHFTRTVDPEPGRGYLLNDPYHGGTHLPDLTYVEPWYHGETLHGFVVNRAHHSDVGGSTPGSMAVETHIDQEGFRTGPREVARDGQLDRRAVDDLLEASRTPEERVTDLQAQIASARRGIRRLKEWRTRLDGVVPETVYDGLGAYSERFTRSLIGGFRPGEYTAEEWLDGDGTGSGPIRLRVRLEVSGERLVLDFRESQDQVHGSLNCPRAVAVSASYYVLRSLLEEDIPVNHGIFQPVDVRTRPGSILDARAPAPVSAGNVETSQRVVDLLLRAFEPLAPDRVPAASQGTMNNVTFGLEDGPSYYETLGGGAGAGADHDGLSGRQVHMTNTQNTPIEEFERRFPVRVEVLRLRDDSGGSGRGRGGEGLLKIWRALAPVAAGVLSDRRRFRPYGTRGGSAGRPGLNLLYTRGGRRVLPGKFHRLLSAGDRLCLRTPGGGGWGRKEETRAPGET